jgi:glucan phosphorylase
MRAHNPSLNATLFQAELVKSVRSEFEHNLAQQIFISTGTWEIIRNSKDEVIKLVHMAGSQMNEKSTSTDLSEKIFEIIAQLEEFPTSIAVKIVKKEFQELF